MLRGAKSIPSCFITGTDTDAGKTVVTASLLRYLAENAVPSAGLKPIASGFDQRDGQWRNADIDAITSASSVKLPDDVINQYAFKPAIAPHIAAAEEGVELCFERIAAAVKQAKKHVDTVLVEAVGGWYVPLESSGQAQGRNVAGLAKRLNLPVIMVVGMRLGCLNHALLTAQAIQNDGLELFAWVANNVLPDFARKDENLATLKCMLPAPMLFELPYLSCAGQLDTYTPKFGQIGGV